MERTSVIIHYFSWQVESGFLVRRAVIVSFPLSTRRPFLRGARNPLGEPVDQESALGASKALPTRSKDPSLSGIDYDLHVFVAGISKQLLMLLGTEKFHARDWKIFFD